MRIQQRIQEQINRAKFEHRTAVHVEEGDVHLGALTKDLMNLVYIHPSSQSAAERPYNGMRVDVQHYTPYTHTTVGSQRIAGAEVKFENGRALVASKDRAVSLSVPTPEGEAFVALSHVGKQPNDEVWIDQSNTTGDVRMTFFPQHDDTPGATALLHPDGEMWLRSGQSRTWQRYDIQGRPSTTDPTGPNLPQLGLP
ncbi:MAG TPA: hypothetical protein VGO93_27890 [Candidatus Xenobia bacterium]|jgi:hypothetical protein